MFTGWIRAYSEENSHVRAKNPYYNRQKRAEFRKAFKTDIKSEAKDSAAVLKIVKWGDAVELPSRLSTTKWTRVKFKTEGWEVMNADTAYQDRLFEKIPDPNFAGESLIWSMAKQSRNYEESLRYPAEDSRYEKEKMNKLGL